MQTQQRRPLAPARSQNSAPKPRNPAEEAEMRLSDPEQLGIKLQKLVQLHEASRQTHQTQLDKVRSDLSLSREAEIKLERTNAELRREIEKAKSVGPTKGASSSAVIAKYIEEKAELAKTNRGLQRENFDLKSSREKWQNDTKEVDGVRRRMERLEDMLDETTAAYGRLHSGSIGRKEHERMNNERIQLLEALEKSRGRETLLRSELRDVKEQGVEQEAQLQRAKRDRQETESSLDAVLRQWQLDRDGRDECAQVFSELEPMEDNSDTAWRSLATLNAGHADLLSSHRTGELLITLREHRQTMADHQEAARSFETARTTIFTLKESHNTLADRCKAIETAHGSCSTKLEAVQAQLKICEQSKASLQIALGRVREDLKRSEQAERTNKAALKRANDGTLRWKSAEGVMEDDIFRLQEQLEEALQFEPLYNQLLEDNRLIAAREAFAAEEAEQLAIQNAQLMGHDPTGEQKITYMENVRRDLATAKQELASTRHLLNAAQERIADLTTEVESYKSIDPDAALGGSTRTRVVRRQPEGAWLSSSVKDKTPVRRSH